MTAETTERKGNLSTALNLAAQFLGRDPAKAIEQAREILRVVPEQPQATLILASALRRTGDLGGALGELEAFVKHHPQAIQAWLELGLVLAAQGATRKSIAALLQATKLDPSRSEAWQALGCW